MASTINSGSSNGTQWPLRDATTWRLHKDLSAIRRCDAICSDA